LRSVLFLSTCRWPGPTAARYRVGGKERETSLGPFPELTLAEAREKHAELRKSVVVDKADPIADKRAAKTVPPSAAPTFGAMADQYMETHEATWRNAKHRWQWRQTLTDYCGPIRGLPVDQIATADVLAVLKPLWSRAPETASRLRGRIQTVLEAAQGSCHANGSRSGCRVRWRMTISFARHKLPPAIIPARRLAVYAFHAQLSRRRRSACRARSGYLLRNGAAVGFEVRTIVRPRTSPSTSAANIALASR
jgi:hypothetical protein